MRFLAASFLASVVVLDTAALAEEPKIDPVADEIARNAAEFLAAQPAVSFTWFVSYDEVVEGREKITHVRSGSDLLVRGTGFLSELERDDTSRAYYYDGKTFTVSSPEGGFYATAPFEGGFDALVDELKTRYDLVIPLWKILSSDLPDDLLSDVESAAYLGIKRIAGQEAYHLAFSSYDEDWQVWISTDEEKPLPLMLVGTNPYKQGWPQYRAYLMDWDLAPDHDAGQFTFVPGEDDIRVSFPAIAKRAPETTGESGTSTGSSGN